MWRRYNLPITLDQIWSDDHSNIINFQPLAGVDTTDLFNGILRDDPQAAILIQIPLACVVIADNDVSGLGVFLAVDELRYHRTPLDLKTLYSLDFRHKKRRPRTSFFVELVGRGRLNWSVMC